LKIKKLPTLNQIEFDDDKLIQERFKLAQKLVSDLECTEEQTRQFHALSRQAKEGDNNDPKPGMFSMFSSDMYNWQAYENLRGLKDHEAMNQ
jgi:acyl-CoA-binding protein